MRPPANLALSAARDRASAGRLSHMRANLANPRPLPLSVGRRALETAAANVNRRRREAQSRRASEIARAAIVAGLAPAFDATRRRLLADAKGADKRLRECLDNTRRDMERRLDPPAPKRPRNAAEFERAVRELMSRTGLGYFAARKAIEEGR